MIGSRPLHSRHAIKLWDPSTGTLKHTLDGHSGAVRAVAFSPDSELLASGSIDNTVKIWEPVTGALKQNLSVEGVVTDMQFSNHSAFLETNLGQLSIKSSPNNHTFLVTSTAAVIDRRQLDISQRHKGSMAASGASAVMFSRQRAYSCLGTHNRRHFSYRILYLGISAMFNFVSLSYCWPFALISLVKIDANLAQGSYSTRSESEKKLSFRRT
jgi:hypothetical protein